MQFTETKTTSQCPACGKPVSLRSTRDKKAQYCSRICAGLARFSTRYRGSGAGPADRPKDMWKKTTWEGPQGGDN